MLCQLGQVIKQPELTGPVRMRWASAINCSAVINPSMGCPRRRRQPDSLLEGMSVNAGIPQGFALASRGGSGFQTWAAARMVRLFLQLASVVIFI